MNDGYRFAYEGTAPALGCCASTGSTDAPVAPPCIAASCASCRCIWNPASILACSAYTFAPRTLLSP